MGNKENNVFKDALGVKGLGFKHHGNHPGNHGSHYGNHHGNYHDNHSNHHGNYHAEQLLFSCQCSKVSSCRVVKFDRFLPTLYVPIMFTVGHLLWQYTVRYKIDFRS